MGCNSSSVVPLGESDPDASVGIKVRVNPSTPDGKKSGRKGFFVRRSAGQAALESSESPEELLTKDFNLEQRVAVPPPVSFEIPILEDESIIRKHRPKRLRRLEENQLSRELTREWIDGKQEEAESRRNELLQQRMQSASHRQDRKLVHSDAFCQDSEETISGKDI